MPRDCRVYLEDVLEAIGRIQRHVRGLSREQFLADEKSGDAVARNLEIIGEAVKHVPDDIRTANPDVDWRRIAGLRDVLAHAYFAIDMEEVWEIVAEKLPPFERQVRRIVGSL